MMSFRGWVIFGGWGGCIIYHCAEPTDTPIQHQTNITTDGRPPARTARRQGHGLGPLAQAHRSEMGAWISVYMYMS